MNPIPDQTVSRDRKYLLGDYLSTILASAVGIGSFYLIMEVGTSFASSSHSVSAVLSNYSPPGPLEIGLSLDGGTDEDDILAEPYNLNSRSQE